MAAPFPLAASSSKTTLYYNPATRRESGGEFLPQDTEEHRKREGKISTLLYIKIVIANIKTLVSCIYVKRKSYSYPSSYVVLCAHCAFLFPSPFPALACAAGVW
jgi:hypothetical protein